MKTFGALCLLASLWLLAASEGRADQAEDEAAIRKAVESYIEAFQNRDAKALAALWSPEAEYITPDDGRRVKGRDAIEKEFERLLSGEGDAQLEVTTRSIRFITADVAIEEGDARVTRPGDAPADSTYVAVHVKQDGQWLLDSVRETDLPTSVTSYEHLRDLEWMIGTWVDKDENATVETTCAWAKNKNFLTRSFKVVINERIDLEGTQFIGWDAAQQCIRSWVFDSDGGFAEGIWTKKDNRWIIESVGTLPDGRRASSVNILKMVDENSFTWQSTGREVDGEILPNVDEVTVVRAGQPQ